MQVLLPNSTGYTLIHETESTDQKPEQYDRYLNVWMNLLEENKKIS